MVHMEGEIFKKLHIKIDETYHIASRVCDHTEFWNLR